MMRKLTKEQKIELCQRRKEGVTIGELAKEYQLNRDGVKYLIRLVDVHGIDILWSGSNRQYPKEVKEQAIYEVLEGKQSIGATAIKYGLSSKTALTKWINNYRKNGNQVKESKRRRPKKD